MTQLARSAVRTCKNLAVAHNARTDASAERHEHEAVIARTGAAPKLSHSGRVGIVEKTNVYAREGSLERVVHAQQIETQVGDDRNVSVGRNGAGNRKADTLEQGSIDIGTLEHGLDAIRDGGITGLVNQRRRGDARLGNDVTFFGHNADLDRSTAHVDANIEFVCHVRSLSTASAYRP